MSLTDRLHHVASLRGWDWSRCRTSMGPFGWSYSEILRDHLRHSGLALDLGTGGGERFSELARPGDIALDIDLDRARVARENLACRLSVADNHHLPFREASFDLVAARHVGVDVGEVVRVLRPNGGFVTQQVGGRTCQSIFDAFGWGSNEAFWKRRAEETGEPHITLATMRAGFEATGCTILRCEEVEVSYEFLDEDSLAFWLLNAPLPERVDPVRHASVLETLSLKTSWHAELLVARRL